MAVRTRTPRSAAPVALAEPAPAPVISAEAVSASEPHASKTLPAPKSQAPASAPAKAPRQSRKATEPSRAKPFRARKASQAPAPEMSATVAPAGKVYGYARVSTTEQDLSIQEMALKLAGCEIIRAEKVTGTTTTGRAELATLLDFLRPGDALVVTRIDRLARSIGDLQDIVRQLRGKGVTLKATEQPVDTSYAAGKAFLDMLGVFAEFENNIRKERQLEGIAKAKAEGIYKGRKATIDPAEVRKLYAEGIGGAEIARRLGIGRASVYRLLGLGEPAA